MVKARYLITSAIVAASNLVLALPADAQTSQLQEIIVTARKRQESILNVPVVEQALPQQTLQRFQTQDLKGVATLVPGLALGDSIMAMGTQVSIRGVGTTTLNPGIDQSVTLNIDGLQLSQGLAYSSAMFDMSQVEVLKGPQSLFYGKTSTGGVISVRTADPTDTFEVIARAGYEFEANEKQGEIIVSGPLTDTVKARIAARWDSQEGFFRNLATGLPALGGRTPAYAGQPDKGYMIRGTVLWNPTSEFDARLKINQDRDVQQSAGAQQLATCPEGTGPIFGIPFLSPKNNCTIGRNFYVVDLDPAAFPGIVNNGVPYIETTQTYGTLELNYRPVRDITLTSTTGYYLVNSISSFNASQSEISGPLLATVGDFHRREITEEFRANSDFSGPINFTAGGFIQRANMSWLDTLIGNGALGAPPLLEKGIQTVDITTNSIFGQLRYKIIPKVEIAAGVRLTDEKRTDVAEDFTTGAPIPTPLAQPEIRSKTASPEITVTYRPTDDLTLFGALKRGFKSGSFDIATPATPGEDNAFGDEKVEGGEFGLKSRWLERRLAFNLAAYKYRYSGLQVGAVAPTENNLPEITTLNAGSALVYGVEGDLSYHPEFVDGLNLRAAVDWTHAQLKSLNGVPCYGGQLISQGCDEQFSLGANSGLAPGFTAQDRSGLPLIRAPKWSANFGFDYETDIGHGMSLVVASNTQYSSKYLTNLALPYYQPAFFKTDLSLTLQGPKDRWEFALIGKNLNNALTAGNCTNSNAQGGLLPGTSFSGTLNNLQGPAGVDEIGCWVDRGREVWLRLTFKPFN